MRLIPVARLRALSLSSSVLAAMTLSACGPESAVDLGQQVLGALTSAQLVSTATEWRTLPIGAGGFITGLNLNPDGVTRVIRTDTYGAYFWRDNRWQQLVTETSMPAEDRYEPNGTNAGVIDVASAPSNPQRLYMYFKGFIYRSDNQGVNWSRTTFPLAEADANGEFRRGTQHIAIDPSDPNHVLVGTPSKGLLVTFDGGTSWQTVADVPGGTDEVNNEGVARPGGGITVFFAPKSGLTSGGLTREIYAGSWRKGLWRSQDSGASWQQISGNGTGPTVAWRHDVANDGTLYVAERISRDKVWRYRNGTWADITPRGDIPSIAVDPTNSNRVYAFTGGGDPWRSVDGGEHWTPLQTPNIRNASGNVPWHSFTDENYMSVGEVKFDPQVPGRLWFAQGIGMWRTDITDSTSRITWQAESRGIEQLVMNDIIAPPGGKPVSAAWDRAIFYHASLSDYPIQHSPQRFNSAWNLDWSGQNPRFLVANTSDHRFCCTGDGLAIQAGYWEDGGQTWTRFPTIPNPPGSDPNNPYRHSFGDIAVSARDVNNIVWLPTFNGPAACTLDRGRTWQFVTLPGQNTSSPGSHFGYYLNRKVLAADKVAPNTFFLVHSGGPNGEARGVWRTTNGGRSWKRQFSGEITSFSVFNAQLKTVFGHGGHLFFTAGQLDGLDNPFIRSTNGGVSWPPVGSATGVHAFGFGAPRNRGGYPTIFIAGRVGGQYGLWRSSDQGATWTSIGKFPIGSLDQIRAIDGDKDVFGRVYVGFAGSGAAYGALAVR